MTIKRIAILTSGGDAPGMNTAVVNLIKYAKTKKIKVFLVYNAFKGLVEDKIIDAEKVNYELYVNSGGTFIGSKRYPEFAKPEIQKQAAINLKNRQIDVLVIIGGNGSFLAQKALAMLKIKTIGIPATIDNDVPTSNWTIGYQTALQTIVETSEKIRDTIDSHNRVAIIQTMGRFCSDLAVFGGLAINAEAIVTNENIFSKDDFVKVVKKAQKLNKKSVIFMVLERIYGQNKRPTLKEIAEYIQQKTNQITAVIVLDRIQRGGAPIITDRIIATKMAIYAIDILLKGVFNCVLVIKNNQVLACDINQVLKAHFKSNLETIKINNLINNS